MTCSNSGKSEPSAFYCRAHEPCRIVPSWCMYMLADPASHAYVADLGRGHNLRAFAANRGGSASGGQQRRVDAQVGR